MTYRGKVQGGVVVLEQPAELPEGTVVEPVVPSEPTTTENRAESLPELLLRFAGKATGLPPDAARNHDHFLYGLPKR
jgi:hypothetical protein